MPTYYYPTIQIRNPKLYMNVVRFDDLKTALFGNDADRSETTTIVNQLLTGTVTAARYNTMWSAFLRNGFEYSEVPMVTPNPSRDPSTNDIESDSFPVYASGTLTVSSLDVPESVLPKTTSPRTEQLFLLVGYRADLSITNFQTVSVYGSGNPTIQPDRSRVYVGPGYLNTETPITSNSRNLKWAGKITAEHSSTSPSPWLTVYSDSGENTVMLTGDGFELTEGSGARLIYRTTLYGEYLNAYSSTGTTSYGSPNSAPITAEESQNQQISRNPNCISIFEIGTMTDLLGSSVVNPFTINFETFRIFDSTLAFFVKAELTQSGQTNGLSAVQTVQITPDAGFSKADRDLTPRGTTEMVISRKTLNFGKLPFTHSIMLQILKVNPENVTHYLGYKETRPRDRTEDGMIDRAVHFYFWCKKFPAGPMGDTDPSPSVNISLTNGTGIGSPAYVSPTDKAYYAHENTVMKYMDASGNLKEIIHNSLDSRDFADQIKARLTETPAGYYDKYFTLPVFLHRNQSIEPHVWNNRSEYSSMIATSAGGSIRTFPDLTDGMIRSGGLESGLGYDETGHWVYSMVQNVGCAQPSREPGTTDSSTYWMYRRDTADADIYRQSIKYGPFFFEPELAENDEERTSETRRYTFYFHYFFFDYMSWMTGLWSDPSYNRDFETWKVLDTTDFPFFDDDRTHYADEGTEDLVRKELTLNQKYLMQMKLKVGSDGHPIWPWDDENMLLMWCLMTPNNSNFLPEIEKDRIFEYDTNHGNNMTPLSRKYTDTDELLCKNQVYPFELWWDLDQDDIDRLDEEGFGEFLNIMTQNSSVYPLFTDRLTSETTGTIDTYVDDQISPDSGFPVSKITYISRETN